MNLIEISVILILHWIADYVMQDGEWAVRKSKDFDFLVTHTFVYSVIMSTGVGVLMYYNISCIDCLPCTIFIFFIVTFLLHTITDFFTSKKTSREYSKKNFGTTIPRGFDFFVTLGFDQLLHYIQLFGIYYLLIK
jgi:hypothetical protein